MRKDLIPFAAASTLLFPSALLAQSASVEPYYWNGPWHMWGGWGFWWVFPIAMMILMIVVCAFLVSRMWPGHGGSRGGDTTSSAVRLLNERFAKGEISKEEFEEKRSVLAGKS